MTSSSNFSGSDDGSSWGASLVSGVAASSTTSSFNFSGSGDGSSWGTSLVSRSKTGTSPDSSTIGGFAVEESISFPSAPAVIASSATSSSTSRTMASDDCGLWMLLSGSAGLLSTKEIKSWTGLLRGYPMVSFTEGYTAAWRHLTEVCSNKVGSWTGSSTTERTGCSTSGFPDTGGTTEVEIDLIGSLFALIVSATES